MNKRKFDGLFWEHIPFDNLIFPGNNKFMQENLDYVLFENVDELFLSRDDDYNITISCVEKLNHLKNRKERKASTSSEEIKPGMSVPVGKLEMNVFDDYTISFNPIYCNGYTSGNDKTSYNLTCYHVEGRSISKKPKVIKEWLLNGAQRGLYFCGNANYKYKLEGVISGTYGEMEFPKPEQIEEQESVGKFIHLKYKDTAFDVNFVGKNYGPHWSTNLSISYFEDYGRIPCEEERNIIRDYLSFFIGRRLIYIGESSFDDNGNEIGFIMECPHTYGMDLKRVCQNGSKVPIRDDHPCLGKYFDVIQNYIEPFSEIYNRLDFESFFSIYWYAKEIVKPMDLPILASALENLKRKWYEEIEANPETVLMDKKDFSKRIKPVKELVLNQFEDTEYAERMKRSVEGMNRMSVNEQLTYFFEKIGMTVGDTEKKALRARNFSAHGSYGSSDSDYQEIFKTSQVYECIIVRVILMLLNYNGKYIDYGLIGYPEKDIYSPSGNE